MKEAIARYGVPITYDWFIPRQERAALAVLSTLVWASAIYHVFMHPAAGANIYSLFGMGLLYVVFSLTNAIGGLRAAIGAYTPDTDVRQIRTLIELVVVLSFILACNAVVLLLYLSQGVAVTMVDGLSLLLAGAVIVALVFRYGLRDVVKEPIARGWLAVATKAIPQGVMAWLFIAQPAAAASVNAVMLLSINATSGLRFWPSLQVWRRDRKDANLKGLLLGESANTATGVLLTLAWLTATVLLTR